MSRRARISVAEVKGPSHLLIMGGGFFILVKILEYHGVAVKKCVGRYVYLWNYQRIC